jgi:hypothetical protein
LPQGLLAELEPWGRFGYDPTSFTQDPFNSPFPIIHSYDFLQLIRADRQRFVSELAEHALPRGGWASFGAFKLLGECNYLDDPVAASQNPDIARILRAGIGFLRAQNLDVRRLTGPEVQAVNLIESV